MVRALAAPDLEYIKRIDAIVFPDEDRYGDDVYESMVGPNLSLVAEASDGPIVGYVFISDNNSRAGGDVFGYVRSIAIHPDFRRRGYARALMEAAIERANREVDLFVDEGNQPAIALYRSLGFMPAEANLAAPLRRRMVLPKKGDRPVK